MSYIFPFLQHLAFMLTGCFFSDIAHELWKFRCCWEAAVLFLYFGTVCSFTCLVWFFLCFCFIWNAVISLGLGQRAREKKTSDWELLYLAPSKSRPVCSFQFCCEWSKSKARVMCDPVGPADCCHRKLCKAGIWFCKWSFVCCLNGYKRKLREIIAYWYVECLFYHPLFVYAGDKVCSSYEESSWPPYSLYGKRKRGKESPARQHRGRGKTQSFMLWLLHKMPWQICQLFSAGDNYSAFMLKSWCSHMETNIIWSRTKIHKVQILWNSVWCVPKLLSQVSWRVP